MAMTPEEKKKKAAERVLANALQYSKKMSKFICWVWALYRFGVLIASTFQPSAAVALASTLSQLDWIMLANEGTYLVNSLGEKYIFSDKFILRWIDKGGVSDLVERLDLMNEAVKTQDEQIEDELIEEGDDEDGGEEDGGHPCG